jgi:hypothetical protein
LYLILTCYFFCLLKHRHSSGVCLHVLWDILICQTLHSMAIERTWIRKRVFILIPLKVETSAFLYLTEFQVYCFLHDKIKQQNCSYEYIMYMVKMWHTSEFLEWYLCMSPHYTSELHGIWCYLFLLKYIFSLITVFVQCSLHMIASGTYTVFTK